MNQKGEALSAPYAVTTGGYFAYHPSFSNDGQTIVFSGDVDGDGDYGLYTVSIYGGDPQVLLDGQGVGEYDPAYSKNGRYVTFTSHPAE